MKNKKLFAILTLVCFMFTLMPVAAFAADATISAGATYGANGIYVEVNGVVAGDTVAADLMAGNKVLTSVERVMTDKTVSAGNVTGATFYTNAAKVAASDWNQTAWVPMKDVVPTDIKVTVTHADGKTATATVSNLGGDRPDINATIWNGFNADIVDIATAGNIDDATSTFVAEDGNQSVKIGEEVVFELDVEDKAYGPAAGTVFIWAEETAGKASSALTVADNDGTVLGGNVYKVEVKDYEDVKVKFSRAGEYTVYAAPFVTVGNDVNEVTELSKFDCEFSVIKVKSGSVDPEVAYKANGVAAGGELAAVPAVVTPNNVFETPVEVVFTNDGQPLKGKTIAIETNSSAIEVNKASDVTNSQGKIDFKVAASVEGTYEVILSVDGVEWTMKVTVGNTAAAYIKTVKEPAGPKALFAALGNDVVEFEITDINGNIVTDNSPVGMDGIFGAGAKDAEKYVVLTEAPADSDLESGDFTIRYNDGVWYLVTPVMDAEGTYAVKVILDNGAYATAKWDVKKFGTPVQLLISETPDSVELGATLTPALVLMDANGVTKSAGANAELAATGYAIANLNNGTVTVKTDEKYAGSVITLTAVSEKYDLVATKEVKVAAEAVGIAFEDKALEVNVNNKVEWNVVDAEGNKVSLASKYAAGSVVAEVNYVVLDKPADAKVSVHGTNVITGFKGAGEMSLTSNKVGNVTVQAIVKVQFGGDNADSTVAKQTKYYTGTEIFAVGTADKGDVVVMSIGSNEIVINDAKAAIDAAPIVENNRTFVPFRALAEAFGATVAYDEATQAVTAELNGVTVVMTIGSAEYTVNGVAKTADVAPFINGSRTMVPVRFAAEAFGIKVIPTYDENGATADILFNL